ncbi:MAG: CPBP family intramembrane glutamic endopeptidase [Candidatus Woesearchaeota archaeon]
MNIKKKFWIILSYTIIALLFNRFFELFNYTFDAFIFYLIIPIIIILLLFKENLQKYGVTKGDMLSAVTVTSISLIVVIITTYIAITNIPNLRYYYIINFPFNTYFVITTCIYMIAWEFILRGFTLHGLEKYVGFGAANVIQTILFFLAHYGKPYVEFISTIFTGLLFGYITKKTKTIWPMIIIHIAIMLSAVYFAHYA